MSMNTDIALAILIYILGAVLGHDATVRSLQYAFGRCVTAGAWVVHTVMAVIPYRRRRYRHRERRAPRKRPVRHVNGEVHEYVCSEARLARYELRCPDPESEVNRSILFVKATSTLKELRTKDFGRYIRSADIDHLITLFVRTALETVDDEVEALDACLSEENLDRYDRAYSTRVERGWLARVIAYLSEPRQSDFQEPSTS